MCAKILLLAITFALHSALPLTETLLRGAVANLQGSGNAYNAVRAIIGAARCSDKKTVVNLSKHEIDAVASLIGFAANEGHYRVSLELLRATRKLKIVLPGVPTGVLKLGDLGERELLSNIMHTLESASENSVLSANLLVASLVLECLEAPRYKLAEALLLAGRALLLTGHFMSSASLLRKSVSLDPDLDRSVCTLASAKEAALDWDGRDDMFRMLENTLMKLSAMHFRLVSMCVSPFFALVFPLSTRTTLMVARMASNVLAANASPFSYFTNYSPRTWNLKLSFLNAGIRFVHPVDQSVSHT